MMFFKGNVQQEVLDNIRSYVKIIPRPIDRKLARLQGQPGPQIKFKAIRV